MSFQVLNNLSPFSKIQADQTINKCTFKMLL